MILAALLALALQQEPAPLPEAVQATITKELGEGTAPKTKKEKDGTFSAKTKTTEIRISESGELLSKEEKLAADQLPEKVAETAKKELADAKIKAVKITGKDKVSFEISAKDIDLTVAEDGTLVLREEKLKPEALPQAVADAAKAKFGDAPINKARKITQGGTTVFKLSAKAADKTKLEASFTEDGKEIE